MILAIFERIFFPAYYLGRWLVRFRHKRREKGDKISLKNWSIRGVTYLMGCAGVPYAEAIVLAVVALV